jgi:hypothetical protein
VSWEDEAPYAMIGVQTTLPVTRGQRIPPKRPIGFIWPKNNDNRARKPARPSSPPKGRRP